jgi:Fur family transcriptional regulator, ferric uptake regulator
MSLPQARLDEVRRLFAEFLKERGQRRTPERFAILDALYATGDHLDADALYTRLKGEGVSVSRATVYNTLELLLDCDLVVKHQFGRSQAKYERAYAYWQHDHLLCLDCGAIFEFCDPRLQGIQETVAEIYRFEVAQHALHVYGHCRREGCSGKEEVRSG